MYGTTKCNVSVRSSKDISVKLCAMSYIVYQILIVVFPCILVSTIPFLPTNELFIKT